MSTGIFITIEGPEGSGKTTQARLLSEYLLGKGYDVLWTLEPGGTQTGKQIRDVLLHGNGRMDPFTELMLFEAARAQHVRELLVPALERGRIILCDRYSDSTMAYQGHGRGINRDMIRALDLLATGGLEPDATLLLDIDPAAGMSRRLNKGKVEVHIGEDGRISSPKETESLGLNIPLDADRIEREEMDFHTRVRNGFLDLAATHSERFAVVNADQPVETVQSEIRRLAEVMIASSCKLARAENLAAVKANLADGSLIEALWRMLER